MKDNNFKDHDFSKDFEKTLAIDLAKEFAERRQTATRANNYFAEAFDVKSEKFKKEKKWKHFKFSIIYIIAFLMIGVMIASWFVDHFELINKGDGFVLESQGKAKLGLFDIFGSIAETFMGRGMMIWFILASAGMMGVFLRTGTVQAMIKWVVEHEKISPRKMLIVTMILISVLALLFNSKYLIISLAVIVVPLFTFKGYDLITPILALMLGTAAGISSSLFVNNLLMEWIASLEYAGIDVSNITVSTGGWIRLIVWLVLTVAAIAIVDNYGNKVLESDRRSLAKFETEKFLTTQSNILMSTDKEKMTGRKKGMIITLGVMLLIIIIGIVPIHDTGFTYLNDWSAGWSNNSFARFFWGSNMAPIGEWGKSEISAMFVFAVIVMAIIGSSSQQQIIKGFTRGMGSTTKLLMVLILSGALYKMLDKSGIHNRFAYEILSVFTDGSSNLTGVGVFFVTSITSVFIPIVENSSEFFGGIIGPSVDGATFSSDYVVFLGTAVSAGSSALHAILPTSAVLMGTIWAYNIGYKQWLKAVWRHVLLFGATSLVLIATLSFYLLNFH